MSQCGPVCWEVSLNTPKINFRINEKISAEINSWDQPSNFVCFVLFFSCNGIDWAKLVNCSTTFLQSSFTAEQNGLVAIKSVFLYPGITKLERAWAWNLVDQNATLTKNYLNAFSLSVLFFTIAINYCQIIWCLATNWSSSYSLDLFNHLT